MAYEPKKVDLAIGRTYYFSGVPGEALVTPEPETVGEALAFVADVASAYICRCKQSGKKPFCDGTHAKL